MNIEISVIIPCKEINDNVKKCIDYIKHLDYEPYEIILLPDTLSTDMNGVKVISTGPTTPGMKRNVGISNSNGELCAFIDSDAYPRKDWLKSAIPYFNDPQVVAVGGPGLTPPEDSLMQRAGGYVLCSFMMGKLSKRYSTETIVESDDIHSCNFIARKTILEEVGGWNEYYWPGEDTLLCLAINNAGKKMIEAKNVVVYHRRRPLYKEHLKQTLRFGLHRGFFAKKFRGNSLRLTYFIPTLFILYLFSGILISIIRPFFTGVYLITLISYLLFCFVSTLIAVTEIKLIFPVWLGIITTHVVYGISFFIGLLRSDLKR